MLYSNCFGIASNRKFNSKCSSILIICIIVYQTVVEASPHFYFSNLYLISRSGQDKTKPRQDIILSCRHLVLSWDFFDQFQDKTKIYQNSSCLEAALHVSYMTVLSIGTSAWCFSMVSWYPKSVCLYLQLKCLCITLASSMWIFKQRVQFNK